MNSLHLVLADDLPTLPLYFRLNVTTASNKLVNWKPDSSSNGYTWNVKAAPNYSGVAGRLVHVRLGKAHTVQLSQAVC